MARTFLVCMRATGSKEPYQLCSIWPYAFARSALLSYSRWLRPEGTRKGRLCNEFTWRKKIMISLPSLEPVSPAHATATVSAQRPTVFYSNGFMSKLHVEWPDKEHQLQLSSLQECICELLLRNQLLRMALMERNAREAGDGSGD